MAFYPSFKNENRNRRCAARGKNGVKNQESGDGGQKDLPTIGPPEDRVACETDDIRAVWTGYGNEDIRPKISEYRIERPAERLQLDYP